MKKPLPSGQVKYLSPPNMPSEHMNSSSSSFKVTNKFAMSTTAVSEYSTFGYFISSSFLMDSQIPVCLEIRHETLEAVKAELSAGRQAKSQICTDEIIMLIYVHICLTCDL